MSYQYFVEQRKGGKWKRLNGPFSSVAKARLGAAQFIAHNPHSELDYAPLTMPDWNNVKEGVVYIVKYKN